MASSRSTCIASSTPGAGAMQEWAAPAAGTRAAGPRHSRAGGFTLVEVLVALAVVAVSLAAIIKVGMETGYNFTYLRDRSMAQWVAADRLTEMQAMELWGTGRDSGRREMAGRTWRWETEIVPTPVAELRRVTVRVYAEDGGDEPLTTLDGFISDPGLRRQ